VVRGFSSVTYLENAAQHIKRGGRTTWVYVLTDFDPSGMGIARQVERGLQDRAAPTSVFVERLAVTPEQISTLALPMRPTKPTDARTPRFLRTHGPVAGSVELDTIPANVLRDIVRGAIEQHMDSRQLAVLKAVEQNEREIIANFFRGMTSLEDRGK
jgi:hypothetical protein